MTNEDAAFMEEEIKDIMESLKQFQTNLAEGRSAIIDEVFKFRLSKEYKKENFGEGDDLKASVAEVEKMDALLKITHMEEKKAKLSRLQLEEESRKILSSLPKTSMTNRIKTNLEEFLRLLYETDKPDTGFHQEEIMGQEGNETENSKEEKKSDGEEDKNLKPPGTQQKLKFVERNIQLAKCGRGVLSLTDEEKLRIESLLTDIFDSKQDDAKKPKIEDPTRPDFHALDDETKSILSDIDQRLEALSKKKPSEDLQCKPSLTEVDEESKKETGIKKANKKKLLNRLVAINKLLNSMNSVKDEEVKPLPQEDLNRLIEEANQSVAEAESKASPEVIAELVSGAKVLMPKFKYRFIES